MEQHQRTFSLWYLLAAIVAMPVIEGLMSAPRAETLPYSDFKALVRADSGDLDKRLHGRAERADFPFVRREVM